VAVAGLTVTAEMLPLVTVTEVVTVALPACACTVLVKVPSVPPAVKRPSLPMLPPPATTLHATLAEEGLPQVSAPAAVNCCVAPAATVGFFGESVSEVGVPGITVTSAVPETLPLEAVTDLV
jgi:hypothetical protein